MRDILHFGNKCLKFKIINFQFKEIVNVFYNYLISIYIKEKNIDDVSLNIKNKSIILLVWGKYWKRKWKMKMKNEKWKVKKWNEKIKMENGNWTMKINKWNKKWK